MSNQFLISSKSMIARHGKSCTYHVLTNGTYNTATGSVVNSETNYTIKSYKKHIIANQYNHPNLIGKDIAEFYIAGDALTSAPKPNDSITFDSNKYSITKVISHAALGEICLYCLLGVKV